MKGVMNIKQYKKSVYTLTYYHVKIPVCPKKAIGKFYSATCGEDMLAVKKNTSLSS